MFDRLKEQPVPDGDETREIAAVVRRMRPLVKMVVEPFIARAMEARVQASLGEHLETIRDHLGERPAADG